MLQTDGLSSVDDEEARLPPGVHMHTSSGAASLHHHHSPHQPAAAAATPAAGDGAGGVVHAWKVLPPRVPAPSTSGLGPNAVGAAPTAINRGSADTPPALPPPTLGNMPAPMRMSFGGRPTLAATRAGNASSRLAVASSQPKTQVSFDAGSPSVRSSGGHEPTIEEELPGPGAPSGAVNAAAALADDDERPSAGSGAGGGRGAPPPPAPPPPVPNEDAVVHAWEKMAPVSPAAAVTAPPPAGGAAGGGAGLSPQESGGARPPAQHVLGSRPSLKSMRSGSMTGSRLSRNSSVRHEDYVDESYSQLVGGSPGGGAGPDHISPADSVNQRAVAAAAAAAAVAVSAAANPAYPTNAGPNSGSGGEGGGGAAAGGRGSDRSSAPAAIGPGALPPGVLYGRMGGASGSARMGAGSGSGSSSGSSGGGAAAADAAAAGGVPFRPPLTRGTTTGSLDVPTALSQEPGSEAGLVRALVARGSLRSRTSASGSSRLSRMSSARDGAPGGAAAASPWDLGDIREEDAEGSTNPGERVGSASGPTQASGDVLGTQHTTASGGSITAAGGVISAAARDTLGGPPPARPARLSGSGVAKPAGLQLSRRTGDEDDEEVLEPAWKVLGPAAASGDAGSAGGAGSSQGGAAAAGGLTPASQLSTPGSARRSLKSMRSNSLGSSRLSRMTSQVGLHGMNINQNWRGTVGWH